MKMSFNRKSYGSHDALFKTDMMKRQEGVTFQAICFLLSFTRGDHFLQSSFLCTRSSLYEWGAPSQASMFQALRQMSFVFSS